MNKNIIKQTNRTKWKKDTSPHSCDFHFISKRFTKPTSISPLKPKNRDLQIYNNNILQPTLRNYSLPRGFQNYYQNCFPQEFAVHSINNRLNNYSEFQQLKYRRVCSYKNHPSESIIFYDSEEEDPKRNLLSLFKRHNLGTPINSINHSFASEFLEKSYT